MRKHHVLLITGLIALLVNGALFSASCVPTASPADSGVRIADVASTFSPSSNGFAFINHPGADPRSLAGQALKGLCGGMSFAALDYFWSGRSPATGSIDRFLVVRDVESVVANAGSFLAWTLAPDVSPRWPAFGVATATRRAQVPVLYTDLKKGPVPLGLVKARDVAHVGENHQVVAYAMKVSGSTVRVSVYDPNHPRADDAVLVFDTKTSGPVIEEIDGKAVDTWRGFFVERYSQAPPPAS